LQKDMGEMKTVLDNNVKHVKEDVEETLEIERRKLNIVIHGVQDIDVEKDTDSVEEILSEDLHMDFDRHIEKKDENRPVDGRQTKAVEDFVEIN